MSCSVGYRQGSDPALLWLWLWHRPAAKAPIRPLAWKPPYAVGGALKKDKKIKKKNTHTHTNQTGAYKQLLRSFHSKILDKLLQSSRDVFAKPLESYNIETLSCTAEVTNT